jgi:hypothetical protein
MIHALISFMDLFPKDYKKMVKIKNNSGKHKTIQHYNSCTVWSQTISRFLLAHKLHDDAGYVILALPDHCLLSQVFRSCLRILYVLDRISSLLVGHDLNMCSYIALVIKMTKYKHMQLIMELRFIITHNKMNGWVCE